MTVNISPETTEVTLPESDATDYPVVEADTNTDAPAAQPARFTVEDIERARAQEKEKVYGKLTQVQAELLALRKKEEEREAAEQERREKRAQREAEAERKKREAEEEELGFKELLKKKEEEFQIQLAEERAEREQAFALLERERAFQELLAFRAQRIEEERDSIIPELIELVNGNSAEEIEANIAVLKEKSAQIIGSVANASQQTRKDMVGARVTVPANGPLDNDSDSSSVNPENLRNMSMADYAKNREKLLGSAGTNRGQGIFGSL